MDSEMRCPLCGEANQCGVAQGKSDCWCFSMPLSAEVVDRVPESERNVACICQKCAAGADTGGDRGGGQVDGATALK